MNESIVSEATGKLQKLLLSQRIRYCQIIFVDSNVQARSAMGPADVEEFYTHKFIVRSLGPDRPQNWNFLDVLKRSSFEDTTIEREMRVGISFFDHSDNNVFTFYASRFGCKNGQYENHDILIKGPLSSWLFELVDRVFNKNHF